MNNNEAMQALTAYMNRNRMSGMHVMIDGAFYGEGVRTFHTPEQLLELVEHCVFTSFEIQGSSNVVNFTSGLF